MFSSDTPTKKWIHSIRLLACAALIFGLYPKAGAAIPTGPVFDVTEFGAIGDGVSDDTAAIRQAIQAAAQYAKQNGAEGTVYVPTGTYAVAPQKSDLQWDTILPYIFLINSSNVRIKGDGPDKSILSCYTIGMADPATNWTVIGDGTGYFRIKRGGAFVVFANAGQTLENVTFEGLRISGNCPATGDSTVGGVPETGDGWDMSHKGLRINGGQDAVINNITVDNCHVDGWRGEVLYAGGDAQRLVTIRNSVVEESNASAISMSAYMVLENTIVRDVYNGIENMARQPYQGMEIRGCTFDSEPSKYAAHYGIVYLGAPESKAVIENNIIRNWERGLMLNEFASNVEIRGNEFINQTITPIHMIRLGLYPADPWNEFNNIRIAGNTFSTNTVRDSSVIYTQLGKYPMRNFVIENNNVLGSSTGKFRRLIYDICESTLEQRSGFEIRNNTLNTVADANATFSVRANWHDNVRGDQWSNGGKLDFFGDWDGKVKYFAPSSSHAVLNNYTKSAEIPVALNPSVWGKYPVGYAVKVESYSSSNVRLKADSGWNDFSSDIILSKNSPVRLTVNSAGKFTLVEGSSVDPVPDETDPGTGSGSDAVAPTNPTASIGTVGFDSVVVNWTQSGPVSNFEVEYRPLGSDYTGLPSLLGSAARSVVVDGLDANTEYVFRIRALNDGLYSDWIIIGKATTLAVSVNDTLATPVLTVDSIGVGSVGLSWSTSDTVDGFEIEIKENGGLYLPFEGNWFPGTARSATLEGLAEGFAHAFRIRSIKDGQVSEWGTSRIIVTLKNDTAVIAEDPIIEPEHFWTFDNTQDAVAPDLGISPLELDISGATIGGGIGSTNKGLVLQGMHKGVQIPDSPHLNEGVQTELTISLWLKLDALSGNTTSVIYEQGGYWRGLNLLVDRGTLQANGWNRPQQESDWAGTVLYGGKLSAGEWNHIALVLNGGPEVADDGLKLYLNGTLVASGPASQLWNQKDNNGLGQVQQSTVYLGRQVRSLDPLKGTIDEFSVWKASLTAEEIEDLILQSY